MWDSIEYSGGDFFENPWRLTALYSVGRRPCFAQSRTIILRQGQLNEQYYNSIFVKSALQVLELCLQRNEAISIPSIIIRHSSPGLFAEGIKEIRREYCAGSF